MGFQESLNLEYWFVNVLSGSIEIFIFLSVIFIAAMAARFGMQNIITLSVVVLYIIILAGTTLYGGISGLYLIAILVVGLIAFNAFSKAFKN